ncbi:Uncharacterised protein [Candidatus Venteria ishoeyi]|uniref:Uncharacterized protein n=1 Tax=Candidatus Venteria ishoeyi TaxID=1899563 RepID=A0A1H6FEZ0_9GAMM|nr:Uncharacterised protein [Candidatus Venteria ishoeyi]
MLKQKLYIGLGLLCCLWQGVVAEVISEPLYSFSARGAVGGGIRQMFLRSLIALMAAALYLGV